MSKVGNTDAMYTGTRGKPLDGTQRVSRNTDVMERRQGVWNEELVRMSFSDGKVLSKNYGTEVSLDKLASDQPSYTGPQQGFYKKFGSEKVS